MGHLLLESKTTFYYIGAFLLAFGITLLSTPISKKLAFRVGAIDQPKARGMHTKPMPLAGGTAIYFGFILTILLLAPWINGFDWNEILGLLIGGTIICIVGFFDDIYNLSAKIKFIIQCFAAAIVVIIFNISINIVTWPWAPSGTIELGDFGIPLTILWIVGVTNAVNLIDGLDGLAAGVSSIAAIFLMLLSIIIGEPVAIVLTAALAGSCLGFLPHNFNPATIFMGDTGSTFLGFVLAVISVQGLLKSYTAITIIIAVLVLGLPIFDTLFAIVRRILNGQPIMQADRGHLHHRLMDKGYSQRRAVLTLYGVSTGFGIAGILIASNDIILAFAILIIMLVLMVSNSSRFQLKKEKIHHK